MGRRGAAVGGRRQVRGAAVPAVQRWSCLGWTMYLYSWHRCDLIWLSDGVKTTHLGHVPGGGGGERYKAVLLC